MMTSKISRSDWSHAVNYIIDDAVSWEQSFDGNVHRCSVVYSGSRGTYGASIEELPSDEGSKWKVTRVSEWIDDDTVCEVDSLSQVMTICEEICCFEAGVRSPY